MISRGKVQPAAPYRHACSTLCKPFPQSQPLNSLKLCPESRPARASHASCRVCVWQHPCESPNCNQCATSRSCMPCTHSLPGTHAVARQPSACRSGPVPASDTDTSCLLQASPLLAAARHARKNPLRHANSDRAICLDGTAAWMAAE